MSSRACPCGSGLPGYAEFDARGVPLGRMCRLCRDERLRAYRPEVLADPRYQSDEPADPD